MGLATRISAKFASLAATVCGAILLSQAIAFSDPLPDAGSPGQSCSANKDGQAKNCAAMSADLVARARAQLRDGQIDRALSDLTDAIKMDPTNAVAFIERANIQSRRSHYVEAVADFSEALRIDGRKAGVLINRGNAYHALKKYDLAIADYDAALTIVPSSAVAFNNKGNSWRAKGDQAKAIESYRAAIKADAKYAPAYVGLARVYERDARFTDAAEVYEQGIAALEKSSAPDLRLANLLSGLAWVRSNLGDLDAAARANERSLDIRDKNHGDDGDVASTLAFLAATYSFQGRYQDAEKSLTRALGLAQSPNDLSTLASIHFSLGILHGLQRQFTQAQADFKNAQAAYEKQSPVDNIAVGKTLVGLANVYWQAGKYQDTAAAARRALTLLENAAGPNDPALAEALEALAAAYHDLNRGAEAEILLRRVLSIYEGGLGRDSLQSMNALAKLGEVYQRQKRYAEAREVYERVLKLRERKLGHDHPDVAQSLYGLGNLAEAQKDLEGAERFYKESLRIREKSLPDSYAVAWSLVSLAALYKETGRVADAQKAYERALAIDEKVLSPHHPDLAYLYDDLAILFYATGDIGRSLDYSRRASASLVAAAAEPTISIADNAVSSSIVARRSGYFIRHLHTLFDASKSGIEPSGKLEAEAFEIAQWTHLSATASAMQQMSARVAAKDDALADLVRRRQDDEIVWREREKALSVALGDTKQSGQDERIREIRSDIGAIEQRLSVTSREMETRFPDYANLSRPKPAKIADIQKNLSSDEALVFFAIGAGASYVFGVTKESFQWGRIALGEDQLATEVARFRVGLDVEAVERLYDAVPADQTSKLFDLANAHRLYRSLFAPVADLVATTHHLIVVPAGPLTALPFHLLVEQEPESAVPARIVGYRSAAYLAARHAISILPSVSSVATLNQNGRRAPTARKLVAFGDPIFGPVATNVASAEGALTRGRTRGYAGYWQADNVDRSQLAQLPRLPETADEIHAIARQLGASANDIYLGRDATEHNVKSAALSAYQVVYFATHGLVAGDVDGLAEPALAMSLPATPTADDDGLLTASEAAQLKLDADWVVLSACNTFAGEKPGAEALSGLARAFFYAGARALLVSHWPLDSNAATMLTTATFGFLDTGAKHSEAIRLAMLKFMNDDTDPRRAYPAFWAPFVVVGRE